MDNATTWCTNRMEAGHCATKNVFLKIVLGVIPTCLMCEQNHGGIDHGKNQPSGMFPIVHETGYFSIAGSSEMESFVP